MKLISHTSDCGIIAIKYSNSLKVMIPNGILFRPILGKNQFELLKPHSSIEPASTKLFLFRLNQVIFFLYQSKKKVDSPSGC